jgi:hypothetical protein
MGASAYDLAIFFTAAIGAVAAVCALVLTLRQLMPMLRRKGEPRFFVFEFPTEPQPALKPLSLELQADAPAEIEPEPEPATEPEPPPPPPLKLELSMLTRGAPQRLRIPVELTAGRILELGLPLMVSTEGGRDVEGVKLRISAPNEITYGASLERMIAQPLAPGSTAAYSTVADRTLIDIELPLLPGGMVLEIPIPVCVKRAPAGAHALLVSASADGLEPIEQEYVLELVVEAEGEVCELVETDEGSVWICRPVEDQRQRDPRLPLDRIDRFVIVGDTIQPATSAPAEVSV